MDRDKGMGWNGGRRMCSSRRSSSMLKMAICVVCIFVLIGSHGIGMASADSEQGEVKKPSCVLPPFLKSEEDSKCEPGNCCAGFDCKEETCVPFTSTEQDEETDLEMFATVAHMLAQNSSQVAEYLKHKIDEASAAILQADEKLKQKGKRASDKAKEALKKAQAELDEKGEKAKEQAAKQLQKAQRELARMQKMVKHSMHDTTMAVNNMIAVENKHKKHKKGHGHDDSGTMYPHQAPNGGNNGNGFDWSKYVPNGSTMKNNQGQYSYIAGKEGAPCGKMPYKDFGDCDQGSKCEKPPPETGDWAPGKCHSNKEKEEKEDVDDHHHNHHEKQDGKGKAGRSLQESEYQGSQLPGSLGGPCGKTSYMDFGPCKSGLECKPRINMDFGSFHYGPPDICKKPEASKKESRTNTPTSAVSSEADDADDTNEHEDESELEVAKRADEMARAAAIVAEELGKSLLAASAHLRKAADELARKAQALDEEEDDKEDKDEEEDDKDDEQDHDKDDKDEDDEEDEEDKDEDDVSSPPTSEEVDMSSENEVVDLSSGNTFGVEEANPYAQTASTTITPVLLAGFVSLSVLAVVYKHGFQKQRDHRYTPFA